MRFLRSIANFFSPARTSGVTSATSTLATRIGNEALLQRRNFLPDTSFTGSRNFSNDDYFFSNALLNDKTKQAVGLMFKEEYGTDMLEKGAKGYDSQQQQVNSLLLKKKSELEGVKTQAQMVVDVMRRSRLNNQTGGVRNGVARNPFNMNMMNIPQLVSTLTSPAGSAKKQPVRGAGGSATTASGSRQSLL